MRSAGSDLMMSPMSHHAKKLVEAVEGHSLLGKNAFNLTQPVLQGSGQKSGSFSEEERCP
jgi:hypothetical protein